MSELHVEVDGSGPPLVLWHGWGSNARIFDALRARLRHRYTLHAVDLPGYGQSATTATLDDEATLAALLTTLPPRAVLLGWSLGGQWALRAARRAPQRVRALALVHTTPRFVAAGDWPHGVAAAVLQQFATVLQQDPEQCLRDFLELQLRGSRGAAPSVDGLQQSMLRHGAASTAQLQCDLQRLASVDLRAELALVRAPALVISGQHDRVTPPGAAAALAAALSATHILQVPRAGHLSFLSHPEAFDAALCGFIDALLPAAA
jgi:pimeloyl-[acyl-carrier protein] methyl ester esterase